MSYEGEMLKKFGMPSREEVEKDLIVTFFKHNGALKEFGEGEEIVDEIADNFSLNEEQREAYLETIYRKENRVKKSNLWHRLLYRAADNLAKEKLISRPKKTFQLTNKREWMLTEEGYDKAIKIIGIPISQKDELPIKSYEVEKFAQKLKKGQKPNNYSPFDKKRRKNAIDKTFSIRKRGFRQAVIELYDYKCAVCGLKLTAPNNDNWEVQAAHIVPHSFNGKDDIWNGLSLCRFHHWTFDVGWFGLSDNFEILVSSKASQIPKKMGKSWDYDLLTKLSNSKVLFPESRELWPDIGAVEWHRNNILK